MAVQRTLSILKPDAVLANNIGRIIDRFEQAGLKIIALKMMQFDDELASGFYIEHQARSFFKDLITFMISDPVVLLVLEGENAVLLNRELMGDTNPKEAKAGTIRADFATSIEKNAVHGSDSVVAAVREIDYFFEPSDIHSN